MLDKVNVHDALSITQVNEACNLRSRCYLHLRQSAATVHKRPCGDRGKGARSCRANGQIIHSTIAVLSLQDIVHYHHSVISSKRTRCPGRRISISKTRSRRFFNPQVDITPWKLLELKGTFSLLRTPGNYTFRCGSVSPFQYPGVVCSFWANPQCSKLKWLRAMNCEIGMVGQKLVLQQGQPNQHSPTLGPTVASSLNGCDWMVKQWPEKEISPFISQHFSSHWGFAVRRGRPLISNIIWCFRYTIDCKQMHC